jgi:hypothetical protein
VPGAGSEPVDALQLEEENRRLKRLVADLTLDKRILQRCSKKVWPRAWSEWRS